MKKYLVLVLVLMINWNCADRAVPVYKDASAPVEKRVEDLLARLWPSPMRKADAASVCVPERS